MAPRRRPPGEATPVYDIADEEFSVEIHHGGFFCGQGQNRIYVDDNVAWFDYCEPDTWSLLWVEDFIEQLGYEKTFSLELYWLLPRQEIGDGLRKLKVDADTNAMVALLPRIRNFVIYLDHKNILEGVDWDGVEVSPNAALAPTSSPKKTVVLKKNEGKQHPSINTKEKDEDHKEATINDDSSDDDELTGDPEFVDSDYEIDKGDDDVYDKFIDKDVEDAGGDKKGKKPTDEGDDKFIDKDVEESLDITQEPSSQFIPSHMPSIIIDALQAEATPSQVSLADPGPLPHSNFIASMRMAGVQPPLNTATREGREKMQKKQSAPKKTRTTRKNP